MLIISKEMEKMENLSQMTKKFKNFLLDSSQDMFECDKQCKQCGTAAGVIKIPNLAENGAEYAFLNFLHIWQNRHWMYMK